VVSDNRTAVRIDRIDPRSIMATDTEAPAATEVPGGTWTVDPVHSVAGFSVRHMMVGTFRGEFSEIDATLTDGKLIGKVKVASLQIKDENLKGHLFSPDFFDAERYPEIIFESSSLTVTDGVLSSEGTIALKGVSTPVTATGRLAGPAVTLGDVEKIGLDLETTVNREAVGLQWNAPLPKGGFALGKDVTITVTLELALADDED
jgi:polyisoprenoid-binding protein YceI